MDLSTIMQFRKCICIFNTVVCWPWPWLPFPHALFQVVPWLVCFLLLYIRMMSYWNTLFSYICLLQTCMYVFLSWLTLGCGRWPWLPFSHTLLLMCFGWFGFLLAFSYINVLSTHVYMFFWVGWLWGCLLVAIGCHSLIPQCYVAVMLLCLCWLPVDYGLLPCMSYPFAIVSLILFLMCPFVYIYIFPVVSLLGCYYLPALLIYIYILPMARIWWARWSYA